MPTDTGSETTAVTVKLTDSEKQKLNKIAYELSTPNDTVTASDVLREGMRDYFDKWDCDEGACEPLERGGLRAEA